MKDVLETRDNDQATVEPPKQTKDKNMLNEEQLKEMGVKMMFEMPSEKKTSHIKQAWKAPRLSNGRRNGTPQEIRSPQSHQIGSRALGMGLSRFARTQEHVLQTYLFFGILRIYQQTLRRRVYAWRHSHLPFI